MAFGVEWRMTQAYSPYAPGTFPTIETTAWGFVWCCDFPPGLLFLNDFTALPF